jgi:hypothetical protein
MNIIYVITEGEGWSDAGRCTRTGDKLLEHCGRRMARTGNAILI